MSTFRPGPPVRKRVTGAAFTADAGAAITLGNFWPLIADSATGSTARSCQRSGILAKSHVILIGIVPIKSRLPIATPQWRRMS